MIKRQESNFKKAVNELLGYSSEAEDEIEIPEGKEEPKAVMNERPDVEAVVNQTQNPVQNSFYNSVQNPNPMKFMTPVLPAQGLGFPQIILRRSGCQGFPGSISTPYVNKIPMI